MSVRTKRWLAASLLSLIAAFGCTATMTTSANAAFYTFQAFCTGTHGNGLILGPGQRCVGHETPRIQKLAAVNTYGINTVCVVGKANPDGSGANRYPPYCSSANPVVGPDIAYGQAQIGWPTIINQGPFDVSTLGFWNGWFPG